MRKSINIKTIKDPKEKKKYIKRTLSAYFDKKKKKKKIKIKTSSLLQSKVKVGGNK